MNRLEQTILKNLIYNEVYTRKVLPFIKADYFSDNTERIVFREIFDFVNKYKNLPTHESLVINFTESKSLTEPQVKESIDLLKEIHLRLFFFHHSFVAFFIECFDSFGSSKNCNELFFVGQPNPLFLKIRHKSSSCFIVCM